MVGLHLSETNNTPAQVRESLRPALDGAPYPLHLATQDEVTEWFEVA